MPAHKMITVAPMSCQRDLLKSISSFFHYFFPYLNCELEPCALVVPLPEDPVVVLEEGLREDADHAAAGVHRERVQGIVKAATA